MTLTPPHKIQSFAVIIRAMGGNGETDQRAALNELFRRGLWLGEGQADGALASAGYSVESFPGGLFAIRQPGGDWARTDDVAKAVRAFETRKDAQRAALATLGYCRAPTPLEARPLLPVIFRADRSGDHKGSVTAVFPTLPGTGAHDATCYAHLGQHGTCSRGWYGTTRPATPAEYADLLAELRSIYERDDDSGAVRLDIVQRWTKHHDEARRHELRMTGRAA